VGAVVATQELLYPVAIGSDLGCGMAAVALHAQADILNGERGAARVLSALYEHVPSNRQRKRQELPSSLAVRELSEPSLQRLAQRDGCVQLGTLGRGNHFLEFQSDGERRLWIMVHSGSRALGQAISAHHLNAATRDGPLRSLETKNAAGQAFLADLDWARTYARENRLAMLRATERILLNEFQVSADWDALIHTDHDHVRREIHFGEEFWVHRKGAQSAESDESGLIPGSMGSASFHVTGRGCPESLRSCSHGAGRRLSRDAARRSIGARQLDRELRGVWYDHRLQFQLRDESPAAYKDVERVLRAQADLVRVERRLRPVLCYKGC
jgi:tRNA-splicing ligase RtcB